MKIVTGDIPRSPVVVASLLDMNVPNKAITTNTAEPHNSNFLCMDFSTLHAYNHPENKLVIIGLVSTEVYTKCHYGTSCHSFLNLPFRIPYESLDKIGIRIGVSLVAIYNLSFSSNHCMNALSLTFFLFVYSD